MPCPVAPSIWALLGNLQRAVTPASVISHGEPAGVARIIRARFMERVTLNFRKVTLPPEGQGMRNWQRQGQDTGLGFAI